MSVEMIQISGCSSEMQGVGCLKDGRAVFVPFAIPGETVEAEVVSAKDRFANARLVRVLEPSPDRATPLCPHYGVCGGCQTQHIAYERALDLKRQKVADALSRIGGVDVPVVLPTLASPRVAGYRNKAEFALEGARGGVFEGGTHRVIDIDECPLQAPEVNRVFRFVKRRAGDLPLRYLVPRVNAAGDMLLTLSLYAPGNPRPLARALLSEFPRLLGVHVCRLRPRPAHALDGECARLEGFSRLQEALCGLSFSVSPKSFFQVNRPQAEALYNAALSMLKLSPADEIADVYSGAGTISLAAAKICARVTGIEIVPDAVRDAIENAKQNGLSEKTRFLIGDASLLYARLCENERFSAVIADPPRKGLDESVARALISSPAPRFAYVSCNPATLSRDVKLLTASGRYAFVTAQPVDMFPQTAHVETVCLLSERHEIRPDSNA